MAAPIKILLVGPSKARKSTVASFVAGISESIGESVGPTIGVRILECDRGGNSVELWDVSGDQAFEGTWPAIQKDADGVLLMFDPDGEGQMRELELWHEVCARRTSCCPPSATGFAYFALLLNLQWFVQKTGIPPERVAAWAVSQAPHLGALPSLSETTVESFSIDTAESMRRAFDRFVNRVASEGGSGGAGGSRRVGSAAPRR
jgi:hypothetical protein